MSPAPSRTRDRLELIFGYGCIVGVIWTPEPPQNYLAALTLLSTLIVVLVRRPTIPELGLACRDLIRSLWIFPAALALAALSIFAAAKFGSLHPLYKGDFKHIAAYILCTIYQQFLLQDYFCDRLLRLGVSASAATLIAGTLFAAAHLPSPWLTLATLVWGIASCALFRRYRSIWILGVTQGLLGLVFAVCVPDSAHHHLRVGLGYLRYRSVQPVP